MKDSQKQQKKKRYFTRKKTTPKAVKTSGVVYIAKKPEKHESSPFFRKYGISLQLLLIPLILFVIFSTIYLVNSNIIKNIERERLISSQNTNLSPYPIVVNSYEPYLSSKAAIVIDVDSQKILFSKNPQLRFSMASTVKVMTGLVALDYYQPDSVLTIRSGFVEGSGINLPRGESFYFRDLLYAMMLPSANDAASAIADNYSGGKTSFIAKMNEKAKEFHLDDTHFGDPIGLDDDANYTTVVDLARLGKQALKNKELAEVVSTQQKFIQNTTYTKEYNLVNLNKLLGVNGVNGIKTGTTEGAGEVLITSTIINNRSYIIVVMNSQDRFSDTQSLLSFISENIEYISPSYSSKMAN